MKFGIHKKKVSRIFEKWPQAIEKMNKNVMMETLKGVGVSFHHVNGIWHSLWTAPNMDPILSSMDSVKKDWSWLLVMLHYEKLPVNKETLLGLFDEKLASVFNRLLHFATALFL